MYVVDARYNGVGLDGNPVLVTEDLMWAIYVAHHLETEFGYRLFGIDAGASVSEMVENKVYKQRKFEKRAGNSKAPFIVSFMKEGDAYRPTWQDPEIAAQYEEYLDRIKRGDEAPGPKVVALHKAAQQ